MNSEARPTTAVQGDEQQANVLVEAALLAGVQIALGKEVPTQALTEEVRSRLPGVSAFSGERPRQLIEEILLGPKVEAALQWLHEAGILAVALPEVEATLDFTQEMGRRHKDVWKHTKQVVAQSIPDVAVRWAALLHDIGKVQTRVITAEGKVTFHGHAEAGARLFDRIFKRLFFPKPLKNRIRFLILHHLRANQYDSKWTDSAVRRFDREMTEHLDALLNLSRADITSAHRHRREAALRQIEELFGRIMALREIDSRVPPLPSGLGNELMTRFGLPPGRSIGDLRQALEQAVAEGKIEPQRESEYYMDYLQQQQLVKISNE